MILNDLLVEIGETALHYGRNPKEISLVAVTKGRPLNDILTLYQEGQRDFGESRCLEGLKRQSLMPADCRWHLIGHLQGNKVSKAIGPFTLIHSVDSLKLAKHISQASQQANVTTSVLLQANISQESSKSGLTAAGWKAELPSLLHLPALSIEGLMTMAPQGASEKQARHCFSSLRILRDELQEAAGSSVRLHHLSMGMSDDFRWAIAEGATLLRIGRRLFL